MSAPIPRLFKSAATAAAISTSTLHPRIGNSLKKTVSSSELFSHKLLSLGEFVTRRPFAGSKKAWPQNTRGGSIATLVFRSSTRDEGFRAFEQESSVHGSSEFPTNSAAFGLESTLNNLSKWLVTALFSAVLLWRHDAGALWAAVGSVINAGLSTILKQILNQERPISTLRSDPGMPSSHAQSIFFTIIFAIVSMFQWLGLNGLTITVGGFTLAFGSYLSWLRVSQQLHTISQVVVGAALGSIFSILWFWLWDAVVLQAFLSNLWVQVIVVLGAAGFCLGFLLHIIRSWIMDEK